MSKPMDRFSYELRPDDNGDPDDLVFDHPDFVHIERMDVNAWWAGVTVHGRGVVMINFHSDTPIEVIAEEDFTLPEEEDDSPKP